MSGPGTILLVDDEQASIDFLGLALVQDGYTIAEADSGQRALSLYAEVEPDLVLLDVGMPKMSGIETCRQLIATYGEACAPIIFYTAKTAPEDVAEGFEAGGADYLAKPSSLKEIRARVRSHVQNHLLAKEQTILADQLTRANVAKNRFIGMAAHDMRNPLVSIRGFAEFLMDGTVGPMPTQQLALVSIIHGTSHLMIKTVNELLDVATIQAGKLDLQLARHDLAELAAKSVAQARIAAAKRRSRITFVPPEKSPGPVVDAEKIRQVIDHLLSNAIKYSPVGSTITVAVEPATENSTCALLVRDEGSGLPANFESAAGLAGGARAAVSQKNAGLGRAICRNIIEAHGGSLTARNLPEKGCEFRVTLPVPK